MWRFLPLLALCVSLAQAAYAQSAAQALGGNSAPGGVGAPGGSSGFGRHSNSEPSQSAPGEMPELKPTVEPRQRLDPGALVCHTEDQLRQHQRAILARLQGRTAPEPAGCHIIVETTAVAVLRRDGHSLTEVQTPGDESWVGWTDAAVREADPLHNTVR